MTVLVDSDVLIEVTRGNPQVLLWWLRLTDSDDVVLYSPISQAELWTGARAHEHLALERLFAALVCVPIGSEVGRKAGGYLRLYRKSHGLQIADAMIAASAVLNGAALWTRNRKHYPMRELRIYAPAQPTN